MSIIQKRGQSPFVFCVSLLDETKDATAFVDGVEHRDKDQGNDCHQLNQNVDGWARSILEWIADRVADNGGFMGTGAL